MKIACGICEVFMVPDKNGIVICEMTPDGQGRDTPYQLWMADRYVCPLCGRRTLCGFGQAPIVQHHEPSFWRVYAAALCASNLIEVRHRVAPPPKPSQPELN